jgi:response regulator RpfG family c-di-GMP phosphodiesterase
MPEQEPQKAVLVITEDGSELRAIASVLGRAGVHVLAAGFGAAAVQRSATRHDAIDLAIIDMPKTRGADPETLQALHDSWPGVRMLFLFSAEGEPAETGPAGHVRKYLRKPVRRAYLLGTVLKVLDAPSTFAA